MDQTQKPDWSPRFSLLGFISGALFGVGGLLLMQQSGRIALTTGQATKALVTALLFGVVVPTVIRWAIVNRPRQAIGAVTGLLMVGAIGVSLVGAQPAAAQSCALSVNGQAVSAGTTVTVTEDADLSISFSGTEVTGGSAAVMFGPIEVYADSFTLTDPKNGSEERTFSRAKIADKGVGLYEIDAVVNSNTGDCQFDFFINVEGDPLETPAGKGAAAVLGLGALGSLAAIGKEIASALAQIKARLG